MFKVLIITVVIVPVLLGMLAARRRRLRQGLVMFLALVLTFDLFYLLMLYYLRIRWVGLEAR
jgi:hypothetical protein